LSARGRGEGGERCKEQRDGEHGSDGVSDHGCPPAGASEKRLAKRLMYGQAHTPMGMRIEKSFVVQAPAAAVWEFLTDPRRVASCLPGAAITDQLDPQTYGGTISVKGGTVTASYRGKMKFERLDAAAGEAEISASGQETRGQGGGRTRDERTVRG